MVDKVNNALASAAKLQADTWRMIEKSVYLAGKKRKRARDAVSKDAFVQVEIAIQQNDAFQLGDEAIKAIEQALKEQDQI